MTRRESILSRILTLLTGNVPGSVSVSRSRAAGYDRTEAPAILIKAKEEQTIPLDSSNELSELHIEVITIVRDDNWETATDAYVAVFHPLIMNDFTLKTLATRIRRISATWEEQEADLTAGVLVSTYLVYYLTPPEQI